MWLRQQSRIYPKTNSAKLSSDPIWNDGALGFFCTASPQQQEDQEEEEQDVIIMGSVPHPKMGDEMYHVSYFICLLIVYIL